MEALHALADGFVFGVLDEWNGVHVANCVQLLAAAGPTKPCVFHRAVDETPNFMEALSVIKDLGFTGVLTSGGKAASYEGASVIGEAVRSHGDELQIVVGGGVRASNISTLIKEAKATWYHSSALVDEGNTASAEEIGKMLKMWGSGDAT